MPRQPKLPPEFTPKAYPRSLSLFEAVKDLPDMGKGIKPVNKLALCLVVTGEAGSLREAAQIVGTTDGALYSLNAREHGRKFRTRLNDAFVKDAGTQAIRNISKLANQEKNLSVAMRANEWLAGINGVIVVQRSETHNTGATSGGNQIGMMVIHPNALTQSQLDTLIPVNIDNQSSAYNVQTIDNEE